MEVDAGWTKGSTEDAFPWVKMGDWRSNKNGGGLSKSGRGEK